jgi:hypothetical protein
VARLGRIVFVSDREFFPKAQTLVGKHLHKAIETPIIIHHAVADLPLAPFLGSLVLLPLDDHLPLGKIADDPSPSASVPAMKWEALCRQSRCFRRLRSETRLWNF